MEEISMERWQIESHRGLKALLPAYQGRQAYGFGRRLGQENASNIVVHHPLFRL